jgi:hypothetical protein
MNRRGLLQRVLTNLAEIIDYLLFSSAWGSGGRWFKSSRA